MTEKALKRRVAGWTARPVREPRFVPFPSGGWKGMGSYLQPIAASRTIGPPKWTAQRLGVSAL